MPRSVLDGLQGYRCGTRPLEPSMPECRPRMDTKKCYGEFCVKGGKPAERLAKLACEKSVKVPTGKPTVLYQDIAGYKKDYELQLYLSGDPNRRKCNGEETGKFGILYPLIGEEIAKKSVVPVASATQDSTGPGLYEVVPVCPCCYAIYLLYKWKREKTRSTRPALEQVV